MVDHLSSPRLKKCQDSREGRQKLGQKGDVREKGIRASAIARREKGGHLCNKLGAKRREKKKKKRKYLRGRGSHPPKCLEALPE